jgi:dihydrofolate reductase
VTELVLIAARAKNNVIGDDNRLIWRLKSDLKHFRSLTMGHPVIMGRKTFQSIGKPLPGRSILVLTRDSGLKIPDVIMVRSADEAVEQAQAEAEKLGVKSIFVAGGGEIYRLFIDRADRLEITDVQLEPAGDATFPQVDPSRWKLARQASFTKSGDDEADFSFRTYLRR